MPGGDSAFAQVGGDLVKAGTEEQDSGPFYVVAGSNEVPPLSVSISEVSSPGQDVLQDAAYNAETMETGDTNPFTNFPTGRESTDTRPRNPYDIWDEIYGE